MLADRWTRTPRRLPLLFVAVMMVPALALGWLTLQLLERDHRLETQQVQARVEGAADRIVAASHLRLAELESALRAIAAEPTTVPPRQTVLVIAEGDRITVNPAGGLVYYPVLTSEVRSLSGVFAEGEHEEIQRRDPARAIAVFEALARADDVPIRAGALMRLARNQQKAGRAEAALATYAKLETLGAAMVDGYPAAVLALDKRCEILAEAGRGEEQANEAKTLRNGLSAGAWPLQRDAYEFYLEEARRWTGEASETEADRIRRAGASTFQSIYERWAHAEEVPQRQWRIAEGQPLLLAASSTPKRLLVLMAGADFLQGAWADVTGVHVLLNDGEGHSVAGEASDSSAPQAVRPTDVSNLPWTLRVTGTALDADRSDAAKRRGLLLAGLAMVLVLLGGSGYFTMRGVSRELAVARLQGDFVAAVSHEFRTPLASVRHLSDMLSQGRVTDERQRQQCYDVLSRESERLERLVEDVLDFGRLESGAYQYRFDRVDLAGLVSGVVSEFQREAAPKGYRVDVSMAAASAVVLADEAGLSRVIRNLLDNAVKYSPGTDTIWVDLVLDRDAVVVRVRDRGFGIAADEQQQIFTKFVRGSGARVRQIKGTGIGLAMAFEIVRAHRGEITVESEVGVGSTFAMRLPIAGTAAKAPGVIDSPGPPPFLTPRRGKQDSHEVHPHC